MACGSDCITTLNVVSVPMSVLDTNTLDLTLAGSVISGAVKMSPLGGIDADSGGIKIADCHYDGLVPAANIESVVNEAAGGIYGTDSGFVTQNLVKKDGCAIKVYSPAEHTNRTMPTVGSLATFATQPAAGTVINGPIASTTFTNPTKRAMRLMIWHERNTTINAPGANTYTSISSGSLLDPGTGVLAAWTIDTYTGLSNATSTPSIGGSSNGYMSTRYTDVVVPAGATITVRIQSTVTFNSGNTAAGSASVFSIVKGIALTI
jgi:hypothetical protein